MRLFPLLPALLLVVGIAARPLRAQEASPSPAAIETTPDGARLETIVFVRHAEKPANDEGQLTCQGLNRALALPDMLIARYGTAQFVFAPATTKKPASKGAALRRARCIRTSGR